MADSDKKYKSTYTGIQIDNAASTVVNALGGASTTDHKSDYKAILAENSEVFTDGHLLAVDANGRAVDSDIAPNTIVRKSAASSGTANDIATFDSEGQIQDSGVGISSVVRHDNNAYTTDNLLVGGAGYTAKDSGISKATITTLVSDLDAAKEDITELNSDLIDLDQRKANVDGNYPTMTVGGADSLTPYGENSGAEDSTPFVFQSTGGSSDVGSKTYLKSLRGNSVAFNQIAVITQTNQTLRGITYTNNGDNTVSISGTSQQDENKVVGTFKMVQGHKYLGKTHFYNGSPTNQTYFVKWATLSYGADVGQGLLFTAASSNDSAYIIFSIYASGISVNCKCDWQLFDLTQMFGAGNEPTTLAEFNRLFPKTYYPYNAGELLSSKVNGIKNVGYNALSLDRTQGTLSGFSNTTPRDFEEGKYYLGLADNNYYSAAAVDSFSKTDNSITIQVNNGGYGVALPVRIVAGQTYTLETNEAYPKSISWYDKQGNYLSQNFTSNQKTISGQAPNNAYWGVVVLRPSTGSAYTYSNICFHLTWDSARTGYEPYKSVTYALPNIELRSAGSAYDELKSDGTLIRRIGVVDLGTLNWTIGSNGRARSGSYFNGKIKPWTGGYYTAPTMIICSKYSISAPNVMESQTPTNMTISIGGNGYEVCIYDSSLVSMTSEQIQQELSGVYLFYELATPTETQDDDYKYQEVQDIDDFGTQEFLYDNDIAIPVPQGNEFFYPVDYKAFIDSLGGRDDIEYAADQIVSHTELGEELAAYAKQDGEYENLWAGNLITDTNWRWINDFQFGTGTVDTVFDGEATLYSIRGITEWDGITPHYVNVTSHKSVVFNLYNPTLHYAHVVKSDNENNGLCIYGEGLTTSNVIQFSTNSSFSSITEIAITSATNSTGETYLHCNVPSDGYVRVKNAEPSDLCISNVWGGNRVSHHTAYEEAVNQIGTASYFPTGMKGITVNGDNTACYDEIFANRYYARCLANTFSATPAVSYVAASGTYNIYRMSLSNAMNKGACEIGGSSKFNWLDVGAMSSSTPISADSMSLAAGYIYFAIAQSEDTTYTYSVDEAVVDAETFATELAAKGALYTKDGDVYTSVTEYVEGTTYYYISETNLHGLNGKAINDEIASKTIVYQRYSMDKSAYAGTAISPAKSWTYKMGDFGTEELTLADGFPVTPRWAVYYPVNVVETVQQLPSNYVSLESAENLMRQVGNLQGFSFDSITVNEDGKMQINNLVDTKETIVVTESLLGRQYYLNASTINERNERVSHYVMHFTKPATNGYLFTFRYNAYLKHECVVDLYFDYMDSIMNTGAISFEASGNRILQSITSMAPTLTGIKTGGLTFPQVSLNSAYNTPTFKIINVKPWCSQYNTTTGYWRMALRMRITNEAIYISFASEKSFTFE